MVDFRLVRYSKDNTMKSTLIVLFALVAVACAGYLGHGGGLYGGYYGGYPAGRAVAYSTNVRPPGYGYGGYGYGGLGGNGYGLSYGSYGHGYGGYGHGYGGYGHGYGGYGHGYKLW